MSKKEFYPIPSIPALAFSNKSASVSFYPTSNVPVIGLTGTQYSPQILITVSAQSRNAGEPPFKLNMDVSEILFLLQATTRLLINKKAPDSSLSSTTPSTVTLAQRQHTSLVLQVAQSSSQKTITMYFNTNGKGPFLQLEKRDIILMRMKMLDTLKVIFCNLTLSEILLLVDA